MIDPTEVKKSQNAFYFMFIISFFLSVWFTWDWIYDHSNVESGVKAMFFILSNILIYQTTLLHHILLEILKEKKI